MGFALNTAFGEGGKGAEEIARLVVETIEKNPSKPLQMLYDDTDDIETKVRKIAQSIYGANDVVLKPAAKKKLARIKELGLEHFPVCVAKTQYSFRRMRRPTDCLLTSTSPSATLLSTRVRK